MRDPNVSRTQHYSAAFRRQLRGRATDAIAIIALVTVGIAATLYMVSQQAATLPSWLPGIGEEFVRYDAEFSTAQAVTPGQGQAVDIAGIQVGKVATVELRDGRAVVGLDVEPKYAELMRPDSTLLLRPKTNLNDMVVEIDPGQSRGTLEEGATIPISQTEPNVNFDEFLATLDADTRQYLQLLVDAGATGLGGRKRQFSNTLRRLGPFSQYVARLNGEIAKRRGALARVIHNFRLVSEELARYDSSLRRFVDSSAEALGGFASQERAIRDALQELPPTLRTVQGAMASSNRLSLVAAPTLTDLIPQAQAFAPAMRSTQRFFRESTPPIRDQIKPFTRQVRPVLRHTAELANPLRKTVAGFGKGLRSLNYGFNELAYDPPGNKRSFLFYLPWLNHNLNATYLAQDAHGPMRRALVLLTCNTANLADGAAGIKPFLKTLQQGTNVPNRPDICPGVEG